MKDKIERLNDILRLNGELAKESERLSQEISAEIENLKNSGLNIRFRSGKNELVQYGKIISNYSKHRIVSVETEAGTLCIMYNDLIF